MPLDLCLNTKRKKKSPFYIKINKNKAWLKSRAWRLLRVCNWKDPDLISAGNCWVLEAHEQNLALLYFLEEGGVALFKQSTVTYLRSRQQIRLFVLGGFQVGVWLTKSGTLLPCCKTSLKIHFSSGDSVTFWCCRVSFCLAWFCNLCKSPWNESF